MRSLTTDMEPAEPPHTDPSTSKPEPEFPFILSLSKHVLSPVEGDAPLGGAETAPVEPRQ
jgi:hypothetical protein